MSRYDSVVPIMGNFIKPGIFGHKFRLFNNSLHVTRFPFQLMILYKVLRCMSVAFIKFDRQVPQARLLPQKRHHHKCLRLYSPINSYNITTHTPPYNHCTLEMNGFSPILIRSPGRRTDNESFSTPPSFHHPVPHPSAL